jgi:hypothetical protein
MANFYLTQPNLQKYQARIEQLTDDLSRSFSEHQRLVVTEATLRQCLACHTVFYNALEVVRDTLYDLETTHIERLDNEHFVVFNTDLLRNLPKLIGEDCMHEFMRELANNGFGFGFRFDLENFPFIMRRLPEYLPAIFQLSGEPVFHGNRMDLGKQNGFLLFLYDKGQGVLVHSSLFEENRVIFEKLPIAQKLKVQGERHILDINLELAKIDDVVQIDIPCLTVFVATDSMFSAQVATGGGDTFVLTGICITEEDINRGVLASPFVAPNGLAALTQYTEVPWAPGIYYRRTSELSGELLILHTYDEVRCRSYTWLTTARKANSTEEVLVRLSLQSHFTKSWTEEERQAHDNWVTSKLARMRGTQRMLSRT